MAKHRTSRRSFGGGIRGGLGIIMPVLLGVGAAAAVRRFAGAPLGNFTGAVAGFLVGGLPAAAGGYLHDATSSTSSGSASLPAGGF